MAGLNTVAGITGVATGTSAKTLLQIKAPTHQKIKIKEFGIGFHGVSNTAEPILVQLLKQSSAGTMTSLTPVKEGGDAETPQMTAQHTATVEPGASDVLRSFTVHPQTSLVVQFPVGEEPLLAGDARLGVRVTAAATVNADTYLRCEE